MLKFFLITSLTVSTVAINHLQKSINYCTRYRNYDK